MKECNVNSDCSNGQGFCVQMGSKKYCSCASGFGGDNCSLKPSEYCLPWFSNVEQLNLNFNSSIQTILDPVTQKLTIVILISLQKNPFLYPSTNDTPNIPPYSEQTTIIFQGNTSVECNYPSNNNTQPINWNKNYASFNECVDRYELIADWEIAKNKCNFIIGENGDLQQYITISRKYKTGEIRNISIEGEISIQYLIRFFFKFFFFK